MKTAISIPAALYRKVEEFARGRELPCRKVFSDAAAPFVERACRWILNRTEW